MIEFKNVTKEYPNGFIALKNINFKIESGEFVFIIGASGAGKTTITKLLLKEEEVTKGRIIVDNEDLSKMPNRKIPYYRRSLGYVFQDFRLFPNMTVFDNIAFAMRVVGEPGSKIKKMVPAILETIGMRGKIKSYPKELSGGEQQRVALARAVVNRPNTIIADEPTGNLDPKMSLEIMESLERINNMGKTVIVVTHSKPLVDHFKKRVITIRNGAIISDQIGGVYSYKRLAAPNPTPKK
jgi:cell division transport system ATP-binding protein